MTALKRYFQIFLCRNLRNFFSIHERFSSIFMEIFSAKRFVKVLSIIYDHRQLTEMRFSFEVDGSSMNGVFLLT